MQFDHRKRLSTSISETTVSELLNKMHMESVFCTHSNFSSPWAVSIPVIENCMMFHLVIDGTATVKVQQDSFELTAGDFILLPKGDGHTLFSDLSTAATKLEDLPIEVISERFERLEFGGGGQQTTMICGAITFTHPLTLRLLGILPNEILIKKDNSLSKIISSLTDILSEEVLNTDAGTSGVISRLADLLVITALRQYIEKQKDNQINWIGALEDTRISKAIQLVHESPSKHWSLEELATQVGMSRTSFSVEFKRLVGNSPMEYLTEWRMSLAYGDFQNSKASILTIALDYGYQSESAFSRAFKKVTGLSPGEVRKQTQKT